MKLILFFSLLSIQENPSANQIYWPMPPMNCSRQNSTCIWCMEIKSMRTYRIWNSCGKWAKASCQNLKCSIARPSAAIAHSLIQRSIQHWSIEFWMLSIPHSTFNKQAKPSSRLILCNSRSTLRQNSCMIKKWFFYLWHSCEPSGLMFHWHAIFREKVATLCSGLRFFWTENGHLLNHCHEQSDLW